MTHNPEGDYALLEFSSLYWEPSQLSLKVFDVSQISRQRPGTQGLNQGNLVENTKPKPKRAPYAKMTSEKVIEIKRALAGREEKGQSLRAVAAQTGVAYSTVYYIYVGDRHSQINTTPPITWYRPPVNKWSPKRRKAYKTRSQ